MIKKMSQSFLLAVSSKIGDFANQFLDTVLQCCPTIFGRFVHPEAHFFCHFLEFGRGVGNLFEKKQNKSCCFQFPRGRFSADCEDFLLFLTVFSLFSGFPFYTYGQAAGNHVGNERGGSFHPPGGDYHRHYRRGRQSNHNRDNRNCPRNRTGPQNTR